MKFKVVPSYKKLKNKGSVKLEKLFEHRDERALQWGNEITRATLIQSLIPLGLKMVEGELLNEVEILAGKRYERSTTPNSRWGYNPGSVYLGGQKVSIPVPRVRNTETNEELSLRSYDRLQQPQVIDESVYAQLINGIATRKYEKAAKLVPETFGIKKSTVSNRFIKQTAKSLKKILNRDLSGYDIAAIFIDGKSLSGADIIIAIAVTTTGEKIVLGFIESSTENARVCKEFISNLISRGLKTDEQILFIIDGAKGLRRGIKDALGEMATIQRCQWHKRENVVSYLPEQKKKEFRKKLQNAYNKPNAAAAEKELKKIAAELISINESAHASLLEGLDETLTVLRLPISDVLRKTLRTTNPIESVNSLIGQYTDRVDYWKNSNQRQRWIAATLTEIEPRLRKVRGYKEIAKMRVGLRDLNDVRQREIAA